MNLFPLSNYTFGTKEKPAKEPRPPLMKVEGSASTDIAEVFDETPRQKKLRERFQVEGLRRTVHAVVLVHDHRFALILLLKHIDGATGTVTYRLPGGSLTPGEDEASGVVRILTRKMGPPPPHEVLQWDVREVLGTWWKPGFDDIIYPYVPAHVSRPKECARVWLVSMPDSGTFAVARSPEQGTVANVAGLNKPSANEDAIVAVPLFEVYENAAKYGSMVAAIPHMVSRFNTVFH